MLKVFADHNESTSPRPTALQKALGTQYEWGGFADLEVDYRVTDGTHSVDIEAKELDDLWASKRDHLGPQILGIVATGNIGFVAVFGSLTEALQAVPKVKSDVNPSGIRKTHARSQMDIVQDLSTMRAFCADAMGCNVPVHFLSKNHQQSFQWMLSYAKNILTGPNMASWLPRFPADPAGYGMLCSIRGIGHEAALALLQAYGGVEQIVDAVRIDIDALADTPVNGKRLGAAKAGLIARAVGV